MSNKMKTYLQDPYSLRRFLPLEWREYRDIRLEALKTDPHVFGSNYDREFHYTPDEWRSVLLDRNRVYFALRYFHDIIGMTGAVLDRGDKSRAILVASFIRPGHRGRGLSELFFQARLDWARGKRCKTAIISHRASNTASKAANQRFGFAYTHTQNTAWPDGVEAEEVFYQLEL